MCVCLWVCLSGCGLMKKVSETRPPTLLIHTEVCLGGKCLKPRLCVLLYSNLLRHPVWFTRFKPRPLRAACIIIYWHSHNSIPGLFFSLAVNIKAGFIFVLQISWRRATWWVTTALCGFYMQTAWTLISKPNLTSCVVRRLLRWLEGTSRFPMTPDKTSSSGASGKNRLALKSQCSDANYE